MGQLVAAFEPVLMESESGSWMYMHDAEFEEMRKEAGIGLGVSGW